jgi:hypothetical protein
MFLKSSNDTTALDATNASSSVSSTIRAKNKSHLSGGVCVVALIGLINLSQVTAAPLVFDDGATHTINNVVKDGVSVSNGTTLNVQNGASIDGGLNVFGGNVSISGGTINGIFSESLAHLSISAGSFGKIDTISGTYDISGGSFLDVLNVGYDRSSSMDVTGGDFSGGFSYGAGFEIVNPEVAFTFYGDLSFSVPELISSDPGILIYETIVSGTLLDGSAISQTITCEDYVSRVPCSGVVISATDTRPGLFIAEAPDFFVYENSDSATVTVRRVNGSFGEVSVDFSTVDRTAIASVDYEHVSGTLTFADGQDSQTIEIAIIDDSDYEGNEYFAIELSNAQGGADLSFSSTAFLDIRENDPAPPAGVLQFSSTSNSTVENSGSVFVTVNRVDGSFGEVSVDYYTVDSSAVAGEDYEVASGTLNFISGEVSRTFEVKLLNDDTYEGDEAFSVALSNVKGGASLGAALSAQIDISEDDPVPASGVFQFSAVRYNAKENDSSVFVTVNRIDGSFGEASVDYSTTDATASVGQDYRSTSGTLNFANGEVSRTFEVALLNDNTYEGDEVFTVALSNVQGSATLGSVSSSQVDISEDDPAPSAGVLQLSGSSYSPKENDGSIIITVTRMNGSTGEVSIDYGTTDTTATAGVDYQLVSGTLTFAAGETSRVIEIALYDDGNYEGDEAFTVTLSNIQGGAILGSVSSAQVEIGEDDSAPSAGVLQFSGTSYSPDEGDASVIITVSRVNGDFGEVTVDYSTADFTATAGQDYQPVSGTLRFRDGQKSQVIGIALLDDDTYEGDETFKVSLSNVRGGGIVGTLDGAIITISENDLNTSSGSSKGGASNSASIGGGAVHPLSLFMLIYFAFLSKRLRKFDC